MNRSPDDLLDLEVVGAADIARVEAAAAALLDTAADVLLVQAEAIVALEATAKGLAGPGVRALNVVTGPYGALFGRWLAGSGAQVSSLTMPFDRGATASDLSRALAAQHCDLVAIVHAEAATGGANPLADLAAVVRAHGALLVIDAVASVAAHPVAPDAWGADVVVIGGQKALAGPAGVSALSISDRAWAMIEQNPAAPRESILSLLDLRDGWLASGRTTVQGTPSSLETAALGQALTRVEAEGLPQVIRRHRAAAAATRAGVRALGLLPFIADDHHAAAVVTTVTVPADRSVPELIAAARAHGSRILGAAPGALAGSTLRVNHTGRAAQLEAVLTEITALAAALDRSDASAVDAAEAMWSAA